MGAELMNEMEKAGKPIQLLGKSFGLKTAGQNDLLLPTVFHLLWYQGECCRLLEMGQDDPVDCPHFGLVAISTDDKMCASRQKPWRPAQTKPLPPCSRYNACGEKADSMSSEVSALGVVFKLEDSRQDQIKIANATKGKPRSPSKLMRFRKRDGPRLLCLYGRLFTL